jgi:hypothetical protein
MRTNEKGRPMKVSVRTARWAGVAVLVLSAVLAGTPASAAAGPGTLPGTYLGSDTLNPGFRMVGFSNSGAPGSRNSEYILSANGRLQFFAQADSNLVIYDLGRANWSLRRDRLASIPWGCHLVGSYLEMRSDGDLIFVGQSAMFNGGACADTIMWASGVTGHPFSHLVMQNDGNLVVYDSGGSPTWWVSKRDSGFIQLRW